MLYKNKSLTLAVAVLFILSLMLPVIASAEELSLFEQVSVEYGDPPYNLYNTRNVTVKLHFSLAWLKSKVYEITYYADGKEYKPVSFRLMPSQRVTKEITFSNLSTGVHTVGVVVKSNGTKVYSDERTINVMLDYVPQFMDEFSGKGFCYGLGANGTASLGDLYKRVGVKSTREGTEWQSIEKDTKGLYHWEVEDPWVPTSKQYGINYPVILFAFANPLYSGIPHQPDYSELKTGPASKAEYDGFGKWMANFGARYKNVKYFEAYNEPNIAFWLPDSNAQDYTYLCEVASRELKKTRPDAMFTGVAEAGGDGIYTTRVFEKGAYSSIDCISSHPYMYPQEVDKKGQDKADATNKVILQYGGFKEWMITEIGWPTHTGGTGSSLEKQANEIFKQYIHFQANGVNINDVFAIYNGNDNDPEYNEMNFGVAYADQKRYKPAFFASKAVFQKTNGALYLGQMDLTENIKAHTYIKDGNLMVVMWATNSNDSFDFNENVSVSNMYGDPAYDGSKVTLGYEPVFVDGLSAKWANNVIVNTFNEEFERQTGWLADIKEQKGVGEVYAMLLDSKKRMEALGDTIATQEQAYDLLSKHYDIADKIVEMKKSGSLDISDMNASSLMFLVQESGKMLANYYVLTVPEDNLYKESESMAQVTLAEENISRRCDTVLGGRLPYSESIAKFARKYAEDTQKVIGLGESNKAKAGVIQAYDYVGKRLAQLALAYSNVETVRNEDILLQLPSREGDVVLGETTVMSPSVYNYGKGTLSGHLEALDFDGNIISKSKDFVLDADKSAKIPMEITIKGLDSREGSHYTLRIVKNDEIIKSVVAPIRLKTQIEAKLVAAEQTVDGLDKVTVEVTNLDSIPLSGKIDLAAPEGWGLQSSSQSFNLSGKSSKQYNFAVTTKSKASFNEYIFQLSVKGNNGNEYVNRKEPLSFATVVKAKTPIDPKTYNMASVDDWSDAYPVYINAPANPADEKEWEMSDIAVKAYTKWDENNLYFLIDSYDNVHVNPQPDEAIWNADCVQIAIDTLNTKSGYSGAVYEIGAALTDRGTVCFSWHAPYGKTSGALPAEWTNIVRYADKHLTRYILAVPKSGVDPFKLSAGTVFGMNFAMNDGDWTSRERFVELIKNGTAGGKDTSRYPNWILLK